MEFTPEEWAARFKERITEVVQSDVMFASVSTLLGEMSDRIFTDGYNSAMEQHLYEYTKPLNIDNNRIPKGVNSGATGKAEKTSYFTSYAAFKTVLGRGSGGSFVNFWLTGELKSDFTTKVFQLGEGEVGTGVSTEVNAGKVEGLEEKYGKVFQPTEKEKERLTKLVEDEINLIMTK